jgi:glycosyltransferase involved in cell wall biosynthesis
MRISSERLRVVFVTTGYPTRERPNQSIFIHRSIKLLIPDVDARVVHLRAWLPGRPLVEKREFDNIDVITIYCPQSPLFSHFHFNTLLLAKICKMVLFPYIKDADLIHSTNLYPDGFVASQWAKTHGKNHTTHVIGSDLNLFLAPHINHIGTNWLYRIGGFACNSRALMSKLMSLAPGLRNLQVVYRGVDTSTFTPDGPTDGPQSDLPPVRFLYLGGFHTWDPKSALYAIKGGHMLLEAWRMVESRISPCSLFVGGPRVDLVRMEQWRRGLRRPQAVYFSSAVDPEKVPALIRSCDVVIIPSLNEGLPNLANEAQACGRPVLATDAGGIPESVLHDKTGRIVPRGDVDALAEGLIWFAEHQAELGSMSQRGRQNILEHFSGQNFSKEMLNLFDIAMNQVD